MIQHEIKKEEEIELEDSKQALAVEGRGGVTGNATAQVLNNNPKIGEIANSL